MVGFCVGWNRGDVLKKSEVKMTKSAISGQFPRLVPVPNRGGTGTTYPDAKWYRYHPKWYRNHSPEHEWYRYQCGIDAVPLFSAVSCIFTLFSPNSYTNNIGTLINE